MSLPLLLEVRSETIVVQREYGGLGYALGSTPIYVNQTIGGAVATGTHGSSLKHGSLSNQVVAFKVVLPNGTSTRIDPAQHPLIFRAFQVQSWILVCVVKELRFR